ncbi:MAG TPA: type II toxin-antitoxin system RelE/ParE family toxin [Xanthomonadaceae bacterium]|jgi:putative addiction module killer protein|nr:type II toxin-antitoxin system RelE/ParE family toxin [Xanthomonadaceae bacterium]
MEIRRTLEFDRRLKKLADARAKARINIAVERMEEGNFGDFKPVGGGVVEARIHYGPGYRIYYTRLGEVLVVLLLCGDKKTQQTDIECAKALADGL